MIDVNADPLESPPPPSTGGRAAWTPSRTPPIGVELSAEQALACAFRILASTGFSENLSGHITLAAPDGTMLVNPWGLWWDEVCASDICAVTADGEVVRGRWDVTPAIHIHTELHRRRADARVVVHNHPYHVTVLSALGLLPEILHQTACMFDGDLAFVDEYTGEIDRPDLGADLAERIGDASVVLLANHGAIVTATTIEEATYRAASLDRQCRLTYDVAMARAAGVGTSTEVAAQIRRGMKASLIERATEVFWNAGVRRILREAPEVLR